MSKRKLETLGTEELGKLFPVIIAEPNLNWQKLFEIEKNTLFRILGKSIVKRIEHFGSTAIPNLGAKPTIDILVEIPENDKVKEDIVQKMKSAGYRYLLRNDCPPPYLMFVKGYTDDGIKGQSYHIHMAEFAHSGLWDRLFFRDYLIDNREIALEYEKLKRELARRFKYDREAYTGGKADFVTRITEMAKIRQR